MTAALRIRIHEDVIPGHRLGRNINHDPRSLYFQVRPVAGAAQSSILWPRTVPVFDQGELGSCTGNAAAGALGTDPLHEEKALAGVILDEAYAVGIYSAATKIDSAPGSYPPNDTGSDGLSVAKVLKSRGLISGYQHITSLDAAHTAIQAGPFITGVNWYEGFDQPSSSGLVQIEGAIRGGHEFEIIGYDAHAKLWAAVNSWGDTYGVNGHFWFSDDAYAQLLHEQGDATTLIPASQPAPTPTPPTPSSTAKATLDAWAAERHVGSNAKAAAAWKTFEASL